MLFNFHQYFVHINYIITPIYQQIYHACRCHLTCMLQMLVEYYFTPPKWTLKTLGPVVVSCIQCTVSCSFHFNVKWTLWHDYCSSLHPLCLCKLGTRQLFLKERWEIHGRIKIYNLSWWFKHEWKFNGVKAFNHLPSVRDCILSTPLSFHSCLNHQHC